MLPQLAGSINFLLIQSWSISDPDPLPGSEQAFRFSRRAGHSRHEYVFAGGGGGVLALMCVSVCVCGCLGEEKPLRFRVDDNPAEFHWCAPPDDMCKGWEQGNDGLAVLPQESSGGWTVWCFCGEKMEFRSIQEPCRLELPCACQTCGNFAYTGLRFLSPGDGIWHCPACGAAEQTKKGTQEPLGIPGSSELRMLREQGHVLLECARLSLGKDAAYKALGQEFHFGQSGVSAAVRAIHALRKIVPQQSDASLPVSAQKRRLLRLRDDEGGGRALTAALKESMCQDVKDTLLFGFANAGHVGLLRLLLEARCSANVQRKKDGCTPLHCAQIHGRKQAADVLVAHGASRDLRNDAGETPDDIAQK